MKLSITLGFLMLLFAASTQAASIQQFDSFNTSGGAVQFDLFAFDPFDTALGTLDRVRFNIQGTVNNTSVATPNLLPVGPFGSLLPVPYNYLMRLDMDVSSLAGFDFDFASDAQFLFSGSNPGVVPVLAESRFFSLTAEFDEVTDFIGFDIPAVSGVDIPPTLVNSTRGDFEENLVTASLGLQFQMLNTWSVVFDTGAAAVITPLGNTGGLVTLSYDYTPISEIPVPAAFWFFGTAMIALAGAGVKTTTA